MQSRYKREKSATKLMLRFSTGTKSLLLARVAVLAVKSRRDAELLVRSPCAPRANNVAVPNGRLQAERAMAEGPLQPRNGAKPALIGYKYKICSRAADPSGTEHAIRGYFRKGDVNKEALLSLHLT